MVNDVCHPGKLYVSHRLNCQTPFRLESPNSTSVGRSRSWLCFPTEEEEGREGRKNPHLAFSRRNDPTCLNFVVRTGQVRTGQVRTGQVRTGQVRTDQVRTGQVETGQVRTGQVRTDQVRRGQVGRGQVSTSGVRTRQFKPCWVELRQLKVLQKDQNRSNPERIGHVKSG